MISVNGQEIGEREVLAEMQYHPAASREEAYAEAAEALVVRELLLQRCAALGITWTADDAASEEKAIDELLRRELKLPAPDSAAYRRYYDSNRGTFKAQDLFEASHILYLAPRDDMQARAAARAAAERALAVLRQDPARFAEIAKSQSRCSSAGQGGHLGQVVAGETAPEIDTFLHNLDDGQLCPVPVETDYGVHVLQLHRRIPGKQFAFEEVEPTIARDLQAAAWRRAVAGYLSLLAGSADVCGIEINRAASPLVQ
jgi:peptidyl-prolyl cis-trans isomerase C